MKILAYDNFKPGVTLDDLKPHLRDEVSNVWRLWKAGIVRENYARADVGGVIIVFELQRTFVAFHEAGKVAAALCHGTALLRYARRADGSLLAAGKTVTGFANIEEDFADNATWRMDALERGKHLMPWRIEDELKAIGANYIQAGLWRAFAVRDGNLITGQQNFSGAETARAVREALGG
ncbi:hypothetical protein FJ492_20560 [Mesorhizobium sp. B2-5-4]|uniref:hypothetical protein n=1 Tax=unclassified Mesorhizobium TaxID=325217 RepID=UPI00112B996E|nr:MULTISPECIES: hypothetical protein [unclassified Mesorhizobium]TPK41383.1 hypothetical protein FJ492_20560 [Mesorhizobium sp. B2-5-4]TPL81223.1 hypothetical protein FJ941_16495 [Mesorhizobium sp. B2-3-13]